MNTSLSKTKRVLFLIAVMLSNVAVMADNVLFPITNGLYEAFPNSVGAVNYILSGPPLVLVVVSLITPFILKKVSKKVMMIIGAALVAIGTIFGASVLSAGYMSVMRTLVGIGQGIINVCAVALICEVYYEEKLRSRYIGFYNAAMNIIGMIFMFVSGIIAETSKWQNSFLLYLASIPMLVMVIFFIPNLKADEAQQTEETKTVYTGPKKGFGFDFWEMIITFFFLAMICMVVAYFMAVYAAENEYAGEALVGTAGTIGQIASFVFAMIFGPLFMKLKRFTPVVGFAFGVLAFGLWVFTGGVFSVIAPYVLESIAYIFLFSYCYAQAPAMVSPDKSDLAIGIVTATYGIASFVATYAVTAVMGMMGSEMVSSTLIGWFIIALIIFVIDLVVAIIRRKKVEELTAQ